MKKIDVNRATVDDWLKLPGISIRQAQYLVELVGMGVQMLSLEDLAAALSMSVTQVKAWESALCFYYYDLEGIPVQVNPNLASQEQLGKIPGISEYLAIKIVENRQEKGKYRNLVDFAQRLGLEKEAIADLMHYLKFR
ncbi:MAG: ComEA family DNA-binding protein [Gloeocapsa sp. DLM2.Bin57]|nr:MAG: ComEA family DNA-binding protein [Gloeocapsa sp. DLM2.Bin57]